MIPGWSEYNTPDGKTYYVNHVDKTTSWERPTAAAGAAGADAAAGKLQRVGSLMSVVKKKTTKKKKDKTPVASNAPVATVPAAAGNAGPPLPAGACLGGPVVRGILSPLVGGRAAKPAQRPSLRQDVINSRGVGRECKAHATTVSKNGR